MRRTWWLGGGDRELDVMEEDSSVYHVESLGKRRTLPRATGSCLYSQRLSLVHAYRLFRLQTWDTRDREEIYLVT